MRAHASFVLVQKYPQAHIFSQSFACIFERLDHIKALVLTALYCLQELEEGIGDVDLFTLQEDRETLMVNAKWLQHLQVIQNHSRRGKTKKL